MDFKTAIKHENNDEPVLCQGSKYYVVGHNGLLGTVTIRKISNSPLFTIPKDVKPEELK